jgi:phosphoribosylanthranilate isomerase
MNLKVKICGMLYPDNIKIISGLAPDLMGFIFYPPSKRYAGRILDPSDLRRLSPRIKKTGVFVNETINKILRIITEYSLDFVQLHGNEPPELCSLLKERGIGVIKSFSINEELDFEKCDDYVLCTDYFLFDTLTPGFGGSGAKFNWDVLRNYYLGHPFLLSGGISPGDIENISAISVNGFYGIDLNSRFEIKPGLKNFETLRSFIDEIRK